MRSYLHWGRTVAAIFISAILPLPILGLAISIDSPAPVILISIYGMLPALIIITVVFLPFHLYMARRGHSSMRKYALWGGAVCGGLMIVIAAIFWSWDPWQEAVLPIIGTALVFLLVGAFGGAIFYFIAIGRTR